MPIKLTDDKLAEMSKRRLDMAVASLEDAVSNLALARQYYRESHGGAEHPDLEASSNMIDRISDGLAVVDPREASQGNLSL